MKRPVLLVILLALAALAVWLAARGGGARRDPVERLVAEMVQIPGRDYRMGKYEVTQAQWEAVMGENPSKFKGADHPVECVSWDDCQVFLEKLNAHPAARASGLVFRLPTEEEWETACRAGSTNDYCRLADGTEITEATLGRVAWFDENLSTRPRWLSRFLAFAEGLVDRCARSTGAKPSRTSPWDGRSRTRGGSTICTATCGSGQRRRLARAASTAAAAGTTRPGAASPPTGTGTRPSAGATTSASASAPRSAPPRKKLTQRAQRTQSLAPPLGSWRAKRD